MGSGETGAGGAGAGLGVAATGGLAGTTTVDSRVWGFGAGGIVSGTIEAVATVCGDDGLLPVGLAAVDPDLSELSGCDLGCGDLVVDGATCFGNVLRVFRFRSMNSSEAKSGEGLAGFCTGEGFAPVLALGVERPVHRPKLDGFITT